MWLGNAMTSSTLLADPPSNETIDVFCINNIYTTKTDCTEDVAKPRIQTGEVSSGHRSAADTFQARSRVTQAFCIAKGPQYFVFLDRAFSMMKTKINQQNAQINSGLVYY